MEKLNWAIATMKKCYVVPNMIDPRLLKDDLAFQIAMTQITNAIEAGDISREDVEKQIMDLGVVQ